MEPKPPPPRWNNISNNNSKKLFLTEIQPDLYDEDGNAIEENTSETLTSYYQNDPEKGFTMDIMMMLDMDKVGTLRQEFQEKNRGLTISEFVQVMIRFVQNTPPPKDENSHLHQLTQQQLIAYLCELFAQIDINGDGSMEWEEFTSFIVDTGLTAQSQHPNSIQLYHHSPWDDLSKHCAIIDRLYYFPSNDRLALCENGTNSLKIYNNNCELVRTIKPPDGFVLCAEYVDQLNQYVISSSDLQLRFYDDVNFKMIKSCHTPTSQNCLKWYPASSILFSASANGVINAWNADKMEEKHHMGGIGRDGRILTRSHDDVVLDLLNLPTLESLASASMDKTIRLWDVTSGRLKQQLDGHCKGVRSLAYSAEYRFLVSAGFDFDAIVWNPYVDQMILRLHGHTNSLCGVEIIPDTPQIITADIDGIFKVWDIRNFSCMQTFAAENITDTKRFVAVNSQKRLVSCGKKLTIFEYERLQNPKLTDDLPIFAAIYNPVSLTFITVAGNDVKIWDARLGKLLRIYRGLSTTDLTSVCLDHRGRKFIVGDHDGNIHVYDYLNGALMKSFQYTEENQKAHKSEVSRLVYCNEYSTVISCSWDTSIAIHDESDPERGILLRRITGGHTSDITCLAFSFNLSLIATGSMDCMLQIWDYEFGRLNGTCIGHTSGVAAILFLDPYPLLASCDLNGNICIWGARPSKYKCQCLFRFKPQNSHLAIGTIAHIASLTSCCTWHTKTPSHSSSKESIRDIKNYYLIGGDAQGYVSVWDIYPILYRLEADFGVKRIDKPIECSNPQRHLHVNSYETVRKIKTSPEYIAYHARELHCAFSFTSKMPLIHLNMIECSHQWRAHHDVIYSVQLIIEGNNVITASFDRLVKIWKMNGECLGVLTQGDMETARRAWKFAIDYQAQELAKLTRAKPVIDEVHVMMQQSRNAPFIHRHRKPEKVDEEREFLSTKTVQTNTSNSLLPPLNLLALRKATLASKDSSTIRKTPHIKPVQLKNAGRSIRGGSISKS